MKDIDPFFANMKMFRRRILFGVQTHDDELLQLRRDKHMKPIRNIVKLIVNNVSSNGSINFGPTIYKGLNENSKEVGGNL